jgi:acyl transferase domain-containing protein
VPWPCDPKGIRRASVNSFGFGGTNVHVVLDDVESYMHNSPHTPEQTNGHLLDPTTSTNAHVETDLVPPRLLLLSAADENGCHRLARSLDGFPHIWDDEDDRGVLNDFIYTLNTRRTRLPWRSFAVIQSSSWTKRLEGVISQPRLREDTLLNFAFVFTGQGAQWTGMGRELLSWPGFLESVLKSQACVKQFGCRWSLIGSYSPTRRLTADSPKICFQPTRVPFR